MNLLEDIKNPYSHEALRRNNWENISYYTWGRQWLETVNNFSQYKLKNKSKKELYALALDSRIPSKCHMKKIDIIRALIKI
tara:strand:+ start:630 stop:872 length:243 start_codon:yes stop_codon:yes gene_type:complete